MDYGTLLTPHEMRQVARCRTSAWQHNLDGMTHEELVCLLHASEIHIPPTRFGRAPHYRFGNKWKASFVYSKLHSARKEISEQELIHAEWVGFFKTQPHEYMGRVKFDALPLQLGGVGNQKCGQFLTESHVLRKNHAGEDVEPINYLWRLDENEIQIHHFPPLQVVRHSKTWGFQLSNESTLFFQCNYPGFDLEKLKARLDFELDSSSGSED